MERYWPPPIDQTVKVIVSPRGKTVSAFTFNNAGTRFAAGGHDHEVRIYDFNALDPNKPEPIVSVQPCGQTIIKNLDFSTDDERILVISGGCQAVVMAKDGTERKTCIKGDQYIADMTNTKGHVQMLNDGCWMPKNDSTFITCSNDATIRIWSLNNLNQQNSVIKIRSPVNGLKSIPNVCKYSRESLSIVTGCNDGSVMFWDTRRKFINTSNCIKNAHLKGSEITGLDFSYAMTKLCTRSEDESCKVWDLRQLKQALCVRTGLSTNYSSADCLFSPDDKFVLLGTSGSSKLAGQIHFLDATELTTQSTIDLPELNLSAIRSRWHPKINHLGYSCNQGYLWLAHDPVRSAGGGLAITQPDSASATNRGLKRKKYVSSGAISSIESTGGGGGGGGGSKKIVTPHALPLFRDSTTSSFAKLRQDPKRSYKPEMPAQGGGAGGTVRPVGSTLSSYIARNIARPIDDGSMSIRDRILRHASGGDDSATAGAAGQRTAADGDGAIGGRARLEKEEEAAAAGGAIGGRARQEEESSSAATPTDESRPRQQQQQQ